MKKAFLLIPLFASVLLSVRGDNLPTDRNIIEPGRDLYKYMLGLSKSGSKYKGLIAGHWLGSSYGKVVGASNRFNLGEIVEIRRRTGQWPGMIDGWICPGGYGDKKTAGIDELRDCMFYDDMLIDYALWWKNGGIVHVDASFYAPMADGYKDRYYGGKEHPEAKVNVDSLLTPGNAAYDEWWAMCDRMTVFFKALEKENIPVVFRPFTEASMNTNFWYSSRTFGPENFIRLYRALHDHLVTEKGCHNILWDFQGDKNVPCYPGDDYVDVLTAQSDYATWNSCCYHNVDPTANKPMGNGEMGDYGPGPFGRPGFVPSPEKVKSWRSWVDWARDEAPNLCFYTIWGRTFSPVKKPDSDYRYPGFEAEYVSIMNDPYIVTRDDIALVPSAATLPYEYAYKAGNVDLTPGYGAWDVTPAGISCAGGGRLSNLYIGSTSWTDYAVRTRLKAPAAGYVGVMVRAVACNIYYSVEIGSGRMSVYRNFVDARDQLASTPVKAAAGDDIALQVSLAGDRIEATATVNGRKYACQGRDDSIAAGCVGLVCSGAPLTVSALTVASLGVSAAK